MPVSYTHLDVYKRQVVYRVAGAVKAAKQAAEAIEVEVVEEDSEENE